MSTIQDILAFVNDDIDSDSIAGIHKHSAEQGVASRIVCIKVLHWVRGRNRFGRKSKLTLDDSPWCRALRAAILDVGPLSKIFAVEGDKVDFRSDLDPKVISEIEAEVVEHYRPVMFTD